jgi:hypothetical protein
MNINYLEEVHDYIRSRDAANSDLHLLSVTPVYRLRRASIGELPLSGFALNPRKTFADFKEQIFISAFYYRYHKRLIEDWAFEESGGLPYLI